MERFSVLQIRRRPGGPGSLYRRVGLATLRCFFTLSPPCCSIDAYCGIVCLLQSLCEYCLVDLLLKKNPLMFSQHFIECIFHFNAYEKHKKYNRFPQTER